MVTSQCPECKETIGGTNHNLVGTSQSAVEMYRGALPPEVHDPFVVRYH